MSFKLDFKRKTIDKSVVKEIKAMSIQERFDNIFVKTKSENNRLYSNVNYKVVANVNGVDYTLGTASVSILALSNVNCLAYFQRDSKEVFINSFYPLSRTNPNVKVSSCIDGFGYLNNKRNIAQKNIENDISLKGFKIGVFSMYKMLDDVNLNLQKHISSSALYNSTIKSSLLSGEGKGLFDSFLSSNEIQNGNYHFNDAFSRIDEKIKTYNIKI